MESHELTSGAPRTIEYHIPNGGIDMNGISSESGRLNQALCRMVQQGYGQDARAIADSIRNLRPLTGKQLDGSKAVLLMALHRRGPFASQWDFQTPRGYRRPAVG